MDMGVDIDDTYVVSMDVGGNYETMIIDVVSRYAIRNLILNLEYGQILWRWDENVVKLYDAKNTRWIYFIFAQGHTTEGYNKNIVEDMYIEEMDLFVKTIIVKASYPNDLDNDIRVLKILEKVEEK